MCRVCVDALRVGPSVVNSSIARVTSQNVHDCMSYFRMWVWLSDVFKSCHYIDNTYKKKEGNETKQNQVKQNYNNYSSIEAQIGDSFRVP